MLLDLFGLIYQDGDAPVVSRGTYTPARRQPAPKPAATVYQDTGLLVGKAMQVSAVVASPRIMVRASRLVGRPGRLTAVLFSRPAARWADRGRVAASPAVLSSTNGFISGAVAISLSDDELLLGGDL